MAENGAVIPIEVTCRMEGAESIALLAEKNPFPSWPLCRPRRRHGGLSQHPFQDGPDLRRQGGGEGRRQAVHRQPRNQGHHRRLRRRGAGE
ncbi:MAG: hypothetical protein M5R42_08020 [Rhodocyclaceae bacterium]|nr:hypothetical protein [Rhodocyclaceae bacterium]